MRTMEAMGDDGCAVGWDPEARCVVMTWDGYRPGAPFRTANERVLAEIEARGASRLLGDIERLGEIDAADQAWLAHDWMPRAAAAGLRHAALVTPAFELRHSPVRLVGEDRPKTLALEYFDDPEAGRSWLKDREPAGD